MDILQKALKNLNSCCVEKSYVVCDGMQYPSDMNIEFHSTENTQYTLESIMMYFLTIRMPHYQYVELCTEKNIKPVSLPDKPRVLEEIKRFIPPISTGRFIYPTYTLNDRKYEIPAVYDEYYVLVSNSLTSKICPANFISLIRDNKLEKADTGVLSAKSESFQAKGISFKVFVDPSRFTPDDWDRVKLVYLDNVDEQKYEWQCDIAKLSKQALFLSCEMQPVRHFKLLISENRLKNYEEMWKAIFEFLQ